MPHIHSLFSGAARYPEISLNPQKLAGIGSELVSLYQYLLPVFFFFSAVLMGLDTLRWAQVAAMAVIIAGMVLTNIGKRHRHS